MDLKVNVDNTRSYNKTGNYQAQSKGQTVSDFDVMLNSPILVQKNERVKMNALIRGPPSPFGRHGKFTVKNREITVNFIESDECSLRTCVFQGQFHEIILSV